MATEVNNEKIFRIFKYKIISYLLSIYDLNNLSLTSTYMRFLLKKESREKKLLNIIINSNLKNIFKTDLNSMKYDNFENFCKKVGLVLSGSIMLKALTGNQWAFENNVNQIKNDYLLVNDLDTYVDHNYNPNDFNPDLNLFSIYVKDHKLKYNFDNAEHKCICCLKFIIKITSDIILDFLFHEIHIKILNEFVNHIEDIFPHNFNVVDYINMFPELCYVIIIDIIYMYRHLVINDQFYNVNTVLEEDDNEGHFYTLNYPKIVIDLIDIVSKMKVSVIIPCHACKFEFNLYDYKFLGISKDYNKVINQISFNNTIYYILNKNKNMLYQQNQNFVEPIFNVMLNNNYDDRNCSYFQLEINLSKLNTDMILPLTISNFHKSRRKYIRRIKKNCKFAYLRMLKYYKRGFYTFTTANIENSEFLFDIDNLCENEFIEKHIFNLVLKRSFNEELTPLELQILADLNYHIR